MKCNDCVPILSRWITESEVDLCPKHAMVDEYIAALRYVKETIKYGAVNDGEKFFMMCDVIDNALAKAEPKA